MINFDSVVGHEFVKNFLKKEVEKSKLPNSFIFYGPQGVGKHLMALELAKILNCESEIKPCNKCFNCKVINENEHPDVTIIDPQANIKDTRKEEKQDAPKTIKFREVIDKIIYNAVYKPTIGQKKVVIIDDASYLSIPAMNNLLKIIEEPPIYMHIILITQNIDNILDTIKSRSQLVQFYPLKKEEMEMLVEKKQLEKNKTLLEIVSGSIGRYIYLLDHHDKFLDFLNKIVKTTYEAKHLQNIFETVQFINLHLTKKAKEKFLEAEEFFKFFADVFNYVIIKGNLAEEFKEFYHFIFIIGKKFKLQENFQMRIIMGDKINKLIDESIKGLKGFVNLELIMVEFIRNLGKILRGIS